jgi:hypothetical protein
MDISKIVLSVGILLGIIGLFPWLLEQRGYHMPEGVVLWFELISIIAFAGSLYYPFYPALIPGVVIAFTTGITVSWWWAGPNRSMESLAMPPVVTQQIIERKTFTNEAVEVDGKTFNYCHFKNATLRFKGIAPFTLNKATFEGQNRLAASHWAVMAFIGVTEEIKQLLGLESVAIGDLAEDGKVHVSSEIRPYPNKSLPIMEVPQKTEIPQSK